MPNPGTLKVTLADVHGRPLSERVHINLRHQTRGSELRVHVQAGKSVLIRDLLAQPDGVYRIHIDPSSYLPVSHFVSIKSRGITPLALTFPVDPRKVRLAEFPAYDDLSEDGRRILDASNAVLGFEGHTGPALYDRLDDIRRAGLLNILAKTMRTTFGTGRTVLSYVHNLTEIRGDRFYAVVLKALREETKNSLPAGLFEQAPRGLHHPPEGFDYAGSYKTPDHYGNLHLTFFVRSDEWRADIDIDDAGGLAHVFQVLRNELAGRPTHPYDIHELLVQHQKIDPGYTLVV
jgi:hypothetical protein